MKGCLTLLSGFIFFVISSASLFLFINSLTHIPKCPQLKEVTFQIERLSSAGKHRTPIYKGVILPEGIETMIARKNLDAVHPNIFTSDWVDALRKRETTTDIQVWYDSRRIYAEKPPYCYNAKVRRKSIGIKILLFFMALSFPLYLMTSRVKSRKLGL